MEVVVKKYENMGMNGDRATKKSPYNSWKVTVNGFVVQEFSEYDGFFVHIDSSGNIEREMKKYAYDLADALCCRDPRFVTMKRELKETWVEETENV